VLQYGPSIAGGGGWWSIAGDCHADPAPCYFSAIREVNVGDNISGYATGTNCTSAGVCDWVVNATDTTLPVSMTLAAHHESLKMQKAFVTLQVSNLNTCQISASDSASFNVRVVRPDSSTSTGSWTLTNPPSPYCQGHVASSGYAHASLFWTE
jgi:hypothetical protein